MVILLILSLMQVCHGSNLNGVNWNSDSTTRFATGIVRSTWRGFTHSIKEVEMAIMGAEE
jgi:hypothetical protein